MKGDRPSLDDLRIDRSRGEGRRPPVWIPLVVLVLLGVVGGGLWWTGRSTAMEVRTAAAREVRLAGPDTVLDASGYVTARRRATVSSKVTGKVLEVLVEEGMVVEKGDVLARLEPDNALVNLRLAEAQRFASDAAMGETRVRLAEARLELERIGRLVAADVASRAELDSAQAEADAVQARLARQREEVHVARRQEALWQQQLEDTVIRAPFSGVAVSKDAQPGEMISPVSAGGGFTRTGICTLVDMSSLEIEVDVNESYIDRVRPEQRVAATLDAYPDWRIPARVVAIIPTADRQKATVAVRIAFEQLDPRVLPDMGVKVAFQAGSEAGPERRGVGVPAAAVKRQGDLAVVFVLRDGQVERRAVQLAVAKGEEALVLAGLAAGERVVLEPPDGLSDGDEATEATR